ncbi:MAG: hypothetical protein FWG68_09595 [Defluviitaleaceae bacterium]|nr:hypothetical protein [Defluviitaleaceae bacterium]
MKKTTLELFNTYIMATSQSNNDQPAQTGQSLQSETASQEITALCKSCKFYNEKITATFGYSTPSAICNNPDKCDENFEQCELFTPKN